MRLLRAGTAIVFVLGCGARSELDVPRAPRDASLDVRADVWVNDAGLDVTDEPIPYLAVCEVPDASRPDDLCTSTITMGDILQPGGCIDDYIVDAGTMGVLAYACDGGSSWAQVTFPNGTFQGSLQGDFVDVCIGTTYPFQDGPNCGWSKSVWSTSQRIFGDRSTGVLDYTYAEKIISGHSCWVPCFAFATVAVQ